MIEEISGNPLQFIDVLRPFWKHPGVNLEPDHGLGWEVFHRQWQQRQGFRDWQLDNRGIIEEEDFEAYVQERKTWLIQNCHGRGVAEIEADPQSLKDPTGQWASDQYARDRQRRRIREQGCKSFLEYHAALKKRLSDHGVKDRVLLLEDPKKQDPLTEWHEYLGFECWWQDEYKREYERRQTAYDEKWEYMQSQNWVASHETPEYLDSWGGSRERSSFVNEAQKSVDEAKREVENARQIGSERNGSDCSPPTFPEMDAALRKLADAEDKYNDANRRNDNINMVLFMRSKCKCIQFYVDSQPALVKWVIDQVPLIKAEMKAKADDGASRSKRKRAAQNGEEEATGRTSANLRKSAEPEEKTQNMPKGSSLDSPRRRGKSDAGQESASIAQSRRSARLAAKQIPAPMTGKPTPVKKAPVKKLLQKATKTKDKKATKVERESKKRETRGGKKRSKSAPGK